jgi:uncharacterized protein CbrC (UPF0167 family)
MAFPLPTFKYHPDPIRSGSIIASENICRCCTRARGYIYAGPTYSEKDDLDAAICPWRIGDGSAHEKLHRDRGPTAYIFECLHCDGWAVRVDGP